MNSKDSYKLGVASGLEAASYGDFTPAELANADQFFEACAEICDNKRQYAGHPGYDFNREPNAEALWDAFERGEAVGIGKGRRQRRKKRAAAAKRKVVTGEYSEHGYTVFLNDAPVYSADNHAQDSTASAPPGSLEAVPLRRLRGYCIRTCREIAAERKAQFGGVARRSAEIGIEGRGMNTYHP
jgi:hypothetical protein